MHQCRIARFCNIAQLHYMMNQERYEFTYTYMSCLIKYSRTELLYEKGRFPTIFYTESHLPVRFNGDIIFYKWTFNNIFVSVIFFS